MRQRTIIFSLFMIFCLATFSEAQHRMFEGWKTDTDKSIIDLDELKQGGPPKDGIPSIDNPEFIGIEKAESWLSPKEPVIAIELEGKARAYPLQILMWHEIANDQLNGEPILVSFCPLCYSALVFKRTVDQTVLEFGVSGFLRHSDLVMFDRKTESLWQQFTGKAIVGDYVGTELEELPSQIISFNQFKNNFPHGKVLSRNTGYDRNYGSNPYAGYDDIDNSPMFVDTSGDSRLPPMEKVIGVKIEESQKAYPYSISKKEKVINDQIGGKEIVVFHVSGARSALDARRIDQSREDGSTGVFLRKVEDQLLTFKMESGKIIDHQTSTRWSIAGRAVEGPLEGEELRPVSSGDYFAFAWLVFWPETGIYSSDN